jgi:hypothetical protein
VFEESLLAHRALPVLSTEANIRLADHGSSGDSHAALQLLANSGFTPHSVLDVINSIFGDGKRFF